MKQDARMAQVPFTGDRRVFAVGPRGSIDGSLSSCALSKVACRVTRDAWRAIGSQLAGATRDGREKALNEVYGEQRHPVSFQVQGYRSGRGKILYAT